MLRFLLLPDICHRGATADQYSDLSQPQSATRSAASPADIQFIQMNVAFVRIEEDAWHSESGGYAS